MPKKTEHYQLNQYEPQDSFLRTDFNEDNAKIDAALAGLAEEKADNAEVARQFSAMETQVGAKCEIVLGSYTGDDSGPRVISLGFTPRAIVVAMAGGLNGNLLDQCATQIALPDQPVRCLEIVEGGFKVWDKLNNTRKDYNPYNYIAFR